MKKNTFNKLFIEADYSIPWWEKTDIFQIEEVEAVMYESERGYRLRMYVNWELHSEDTSSDLWSLVKMREAYMRGYFWAKKKYVEF